MEAKNNTIPALFREKKDCCGCGACVNACPVQAIEMVEDACGFRYPQIDESKCIRCGKCKRVCAFQNESVKNVPLETYAAVARDQKLVERSASGGIFAALAKEVLAQNGAVFGAAFRPDWSVAHVAVFGEADLVALQGSKYAQSDIGNTYTQAKKLLEEGKMILFSGTPCQIHGLYGYLGKDYDHLFTVDVVCHGVPNHRMLRDYIHGIEQKHGQKITAFTFRDKSLGWGINGSAEMMKKEHKVKKPVWQSASSYLYYFTKGWIYRENCYHCKYACANRPADLTLGDYWGIEKAHPEYLGKNGFEESKGISLVIANTLKGHALLDMVRNVLELKESSFELAAEGNGQLCHPSKPGPRGELLKIYEQGGWDAMESRFAKNIGWRKYSSQMKAMIPAGVKRLLKRLR